MPLSPAQRKEITLTAAAAVTALFVATTAWTWYRRRRRRKSRESPSSNKADETKDTEPAPFINSINKSKVDPAVWRSFEEAAQRIRADKSLKLKNGDKLMFYGLFKHIVSGDAPAKMSLHGSFNIVVEQAKHAAWAKMRGIPVPMAITHYLAAVQHFASSATARKQAGGDAEDASETSSTTTATTAAGEGGGDLTGGAMGPGVVSRPAVDNGGIAEEDDDDEGGSDQPPEARLLRAAGKNDLDALINLLKEGKADVNHRDDSGQTALLLAADKGSVECCIALLEAGADVRAADRDGISALQAAVIAGNTRICKVLLDHGADADQADDDGDTPRSCALEDGDEYMKRVFSQSAIPTIEEDSEDEQ